MSSFSSSSKEYAEAIPPPDVGILGGIANAFHSTRQVCADLLRLFALEVRRAGVTLVWMMALGAIAAMLIVTTWLGLTAALALWAVSLGMTWISAIVTVSLMNLFVATASVGVCLAMSRNLLFPATWRQLDGARSDAT